MAIKNGKVVTYHDGLPPTNSHESLKRWSRDKLKTYLHYQNAYGHLTCQGGDILQRAPTRKLEEAVNMVLRDQIKYIISPLAEEPWPPN